MEVDIHPIKCTKCEHDVLVGADEYGNTWAFCPNCQEAMSIFDIALDIASGKMPKGNPKNN